MKRLAWALVGVLCVFVAVSATMLNKQSTFISGEEQRCAEKISKRNTVGWAVQATGKSYYVQMCPPNADIVVEKRVDVDENGPHGEWKCVNP